MRDLTPSSCLTPSSDPFLELTPFSSRDRHVKTT